MDPHSLHPILCHFKIWTHNQTILKCSSFVPFMIKCEISENLASTPFTILYYRAVSQRRLKMDQRQIWGFFGFWKWTENSSNIFEDMKIFKGKWKIFVVKNFLSGSNLDKFSQQYYVGKIEVQSFKKSTYFWTFSDNFVRNIVKFSQKTFVIFVLKSSKLQRF